MHTALPNRAADLHALVREGGSTLGSLERVDHTPHTLPAANAAGEDPAFVVSERNSPAAAGEPSSEQLMARVQAGDVAAFQLLVRRHTRGVQHFARRLLRNADDAEDATQDTLLRVWQHAARWEPERAQFSTWLYRIAHNQCIDRLRRQQVRGHEARDSAVLEAVPDQRRGATPDERTSDDARARRLDAALAALPERQRSALVLSFYQGFSAQQAAAVLDISIEALESLLARARRTLRSALADLRAGADE